VIAAKSGEGSGQVSIGRLPASGSTGEVYTENRVVSRAADVLTDTFARWDVHVYRFPSA
jgi:hypothetical protein